MNKWFGKRLTPDQMLRRNQRSLNKAMREIDRERQKMESQEKTIIRDIKKMAKDNQMDAVRILALNLVRTRRYVKQFILMKANIQAVAVKIQTLKSQNAMTDAMRGVVKSLLSMNKRMNLPSIQKIMREFAKQTDVMDMKEEVLNDVIDDAMGDEADEADSAAIVTQVLDELGLQLTDQLSSLPKTYNTVSTLGTDSKTPQADAINSNPIDDVDFAYLQARCL